MARGRHRKARHSSFSRVRLAVTAMALALIGVVGCDPGGGVTGTVVDRTFVANDYGIKYLLKVRTPEGVVKTVREPYAPWSRCHRGEPYPSCKFPPSYKAEGK